VEVAALRGRGTLIGYAPASPLWSSLAWQVWAVSDTQARVAGPATVQIDPFRLMTSAKQLPAAHFADYSFVF
jgi:hypothetical protein